MRSKVLLDIAFCPYIKVLIKIVFETVMCMKLQQKSGQKIKLNSLTESNED